jgi:hypothetical protein
MVVRVTEPPEDDFADAGDLTDPQNPMTTAFAFHTAVTGDDGPDLDALRTICTPESWPAWGDARTSRGARRWARSADSPGHQRAGAEDRNAVAGAGAVPMPPGPKAGRGRDGSDAVGVAPLRQYERNQVSNARPR